MNPLKIIEKYYPNNSKLYSILVDHSRLVADKCLSIIKQNPTLELNALFVEEAAILHDIGVFMTNAPSIECFGAHPYICHGYLGAAILSKEGFPKHALVAERHTGTGISLEEIKQRKLPLPHRDMLPVSLEEQLICFADKFFSKSHPTKEKTVEEVRSSMRNISETSLKRFDDWYDFFYTA